MLIAQKLEKLANDYGDARRTVSLFLLNNAGRLRTMSMADVAAETFTSKATLVRVAKLLGFSGWRAFSRAYEEELIRRSERASDVDYSIPFTASTPARDILSNLCQLHAESAWQTAQLQNAHALEQATHIMMRSRKIALFGVSTNALLLALFQRKCMLIGIDAVQVPQAEFGLFAQTLTSNDCALLVSYTGESEHRAPMKCIPLLRSAGASIIALTSEGDNYLRRNSDVALDILSNENLYNKIGTFSTEESILCLLDALYGCLFAQQYEKNLRTKTKAARAVETNRQPHESE